MLRKVAPKCIWCSCPLKSLTIRGLCYNGLFTHEPCHIQLGKGGSSDDNFDTMPMVGAEVAETPEIPPSQPRGALMLAQPPSPEVPLPEVPPPPEPSKVGSKKIKFNNKCDIQRVIATMKIYLGFLPSHPIAQPYKGSQTHKFPNHFYGKCCCIILK